MGRKVYHFHEVYFAGKPEEFFDSCVGIVPLNPEATEDEVRALALKAAKLNLQGTLQEYAEKEATEPRVRGLLALANKGELSISFPKGFEPIKTFADDEEMEMMLEMNALMGGGTTVTEEQINEVETRLLGNTDWPTIVVDESRQLSA